MTDNRMCPPAAESEMALKQKAVRRHDVFNIFSLSIVVALDLVYLLGAHLDYNPSHLLLLFYCCTVIFLAYLMLDCCWISVDPACTVTPPFQIIVHHLLCAVNFLLPLSNTRWAWHALVLLSAEINTIILLLRRTAEKGSRAHAFLDVLFYATWILFRLIMFPVMTFILAADYKSYSLDSGSFINVFVIGPAIQGLLTLMSYKWTYDLLTKSRPNALAPPSGSGKKSKD